MRPLGQQDLFPRGPLRRLVRRVYVFAEIDSTNAFLLKHAHELPDGTVAWTEFQTAGRGRQGRVWQAPRASSVLLSVLLHEPPESGLLRDASQVACIAACEAIERATEVQPAVRWPNDIIVDGRKVGGVLTESRAAANGAIGVNRALVVGIGINCYQQAGHFSDDLRGKATSLEMVSSHPLDRAVLTASLLERLDAWLTSGNDAAWRDEWLRRCGDLGARVQLEHDGRMFCGTVIEITQDGELVVHLDNGTRRHFAAETTSRIE